MSRSSRFHLYSETTLFLGGEFKTGMKDPDVKIPSCFKDGTKFTKLADSSTINVNSHVAGGRDSNEIFKFEECLRKLHKTSSDCALLVVDKYDSKDSQGIVAYYDEKEGVFKINSFNKDDFVDSEKNRFNL